MLKSIITLLKQINSFLLIGLLLLSPLTWSLPDDKSQPIRIKSDKAESDDTRGISVYRGNVDLVQGSIHLNANELTIYSKDGGVVRITATGEPAHFQQTQKENDPPMHAYGNTINYLLDEERIELRVNARLEQEQNIFTGESIDYDIKQRLVNARGGSDTQKDASRVEMVIQPNKTAAKKEQPPVEIVTQPDKTESNIKQ